MTHTTVRLQCKRLSYDRQMFEKFCMTHNVKARRIIIVCLFFSRQCIRNIVFEGITAHWNIDQGLLLAVVCFKQQKLNKKPKSTSYWILLSFEKLEHFISISIEKNPNNKIIFGPYLIDFPLLQLWKNSNCLFLCLLCLKLLRNARLYLFTVGLRMSCRCETRPLAVHWFVCLRRIQRKCMKAHTHTLTHTQRMTVVRYARTTDGHRPHGSTSRTYEQRLSSVCVLYLCIWLLRSCLHVCLLIRILCMHFAVPK